MLSASSQFVKLANQGAQTLFKATLSLGDGTTVNISGDDVMANSAAFSESTSSDGSFIVGSAVIGKFDVDLNNFDDRFSEYDFTGAIISPFIGYDLDDGTTEWLAKGIYEVQQPDSYGGTIHLTSYDNMRLFERPLPSIIWSTSPSLMSLVNSICTSCGVQLLGTFDNSSYSIVSEPSGADSMTCLALLSYICQVSGNYAKIDPQGRLVIDWYDLDAFDDDGLDGGRFDSASPYATGDTADGGNFTDYTSGYEYDGGNFTARPYVVLTQHTDLTVMTDDVLITGVKVTVSDSESYLYGSDGYVLGISGNPLILSGQAQAVAQMIGLRTIGMRFRPFNSSTIGDPTIEAGDAALVIDAKQNVYQTYITSINYKVGNYERFVCGAESPGRNAASQFNPITNAIVQARKAIEAEKNARQVAIANLQRQIENSSGVYKTEQQQQDGSIVYYFHNKPTLAESQLQWRFSAQTFAMSADGGQNWLGIDAWGNAILNSIYAIGINADYINSGALTITDGSRTVFSADADTGVVLLQDASGNSWNLHTGVLSTSQGYIGGFTIGSSALYNLLSSIYGTANSGVYVGNDGIASNGTYNGSQSKVVIKNGAIETYKVQNNSLVGSGTINSGIEWDNMYGMMITSDVIALKTQKLIVLSPSGQDGGEGESTNYITLPVVSFAESTNRVRLTKQDWECQYSHGVLVYQALDSTSSTYDLAPASHTHAASAVTSGTFDTARIPTLAISKISGLQSELNSKLESSDLNGYVTASLSGTTLTLTY